MRLVRRHLFAGCGIAAALAVLVAGPARAQTAASTVSALAVPPGVVAAALSGSRDGVLAISDYLGAGNLPPQEMARRAVALLQALGGQGAALRTEDMTRTVDRIAGFASRMLATSPVLRFAIDDGYRPSPDAIALDFGPPDAPTMDGFEKLAPDDPRIAGKELAGLRRPVVQPLAASGIAGVERIVLQLPPGDYRLVLMTQHLGDPGLMAAPFGRSMRVNGVAVLMARSDPAQWLDAAVLSDRGIALTGGRGEPFGGFLAGDFDAGAARLLAEQQGGALVVELRAPDGRVAIEMAGFGQARSYITGLLIEPAGRLSSLVLRREARNAFLPLDMRLALEAEILAAAATVLEQIATAAGGDPAAPDPEFEASVVVSSN